jgi:hypothetical protein
MRMIGRRHQFRVLVLLLAFGIGLLAQVVPAFAMSAGMERGSGASMSNPAHCPGCAGGDSSMATMPACATVFCSMAPAILGHAPVFALSASPSYGPVTVDQGQGLAVPPTLGPPRTSARS